MLITIVRNVNTQRYHPFVWRPAPLPSDDHTPLSALRYKSKCHHTAGFPTFEEAQTSARELGANITEHLGPAKLDIDAAVDDAWNEGEVPASVTYRAR